METNYSPEREGKSTWPLDLQQALDTVTQLRRVEIPRAGLLVFVRGVVDGSEASFSHDTSFFILFSLPSSGEARPLRTATSFGLASGRMGGFAHVDRATSDPL